MVRSLAAKTIFKGSPLKVTKCHQRSHKFVITVTVSRARKTLQLKVSINVKFVSCEGSSHVLVMLSFSKNN
jgi:hypothetical protein